jgi:hypothetical protein
MKRVDYEAMVKRIEANDIFREVGANEVRSKSRNRPRRSEGSERS